MLSQKPTETKYGEISIVRQMLEVLDVKSIAVTMDTLRCQREILDIISEKKHIKQ